MHSRSFLALSALILAGLACSIFVGGPQYPATPIPVSTTAAGSLESQVQQAVTAPSSTGTITLQLTEDQITSYIAAYLQSQPNPMITDPQVQLQDGQMTVYGKAQQGMFSANVSLTMTVSVDASGQPQVQITQENFGPLPAPQGLNQVINALLAEAFTGSLGPAATGFRLQSISIAGGLMTITGRIR